MMATKLWDDRAAGWDANEDVRTYAELAFRSLTGALAPFLPSLSGRRVLDFGCGTGLLSERLAPLCAEIVAVDSSAKMIEVLRDKLLHSSLENVVPLQIEIGPAAILEHSELTKKFDLILASSVCSFLPHYETTLCDLSQLLKPGAHFAQWDWLADMPVDRIRKAYQETGLEALLVEEAFTITVQGEPLPVVLGLAQKPEAAPL
jgi:2-polyprenyl-3-methyl-5-hydroxy-6-metoxy-1,4-benzoquinol methylase